MHIYIHTYIAGPCIHTRVHNRVAAYIHTTVPICIHVYTAGYIHTHAHSRAPIYMHMSTTGLLYTYVYAYMCTQHYLHTCARLSICRTWSIGPNTCIHEVHTCERSYRHPYTGLGMHIRTLLYPRTGTSTHAHVCTQAQYIHTRLHRKAHVYVITRPVTCIGTSSYVPSHKSPLACSGNSTVH